MNASRISGTGAYVPARCVTNQALEARVETTHQWIVERTGIETRYFAEEGVETTVTMGAAAARRALESASLDPSQIDLIIVATSTPESFFPSTACLIQQALDIPVCPAFDVQVACSGFIYALTIAHQFILAGSAKRALVIGSEVMSRVLNWADRGSCILFGDGAGAVVLEASETPGILSFHIQADGRQKDLLKLENRAGAYLEMQGRQVFRFATHMMEKVAMDALIKAGLTPEDVDWLVPHQANIRIIQAAAERLNLPMAKVVVTLDRYGNTKYHHEQPQH